MGIWHYEEFWVWLLKASTSGKPWLSDEGEGHWDPASATWPTY